MKQLVFPYTKLFEAFVRDSSNGKRRLKNGNRMRNSSIANYKTTLQKLKEFETARKMPLRIRHLPSLGRREQRKEARYWERFGTDITNFMHAQGLLDNYIGFHIKNLKAFHRYLKDYRCIDTGAVSRTLVVLKEDTPIVVLSTERVHFLIHNLEFRESLPECLQRCLHMFLFGYTAGLRFGDLAILRRSNVQHARDAVYVVSRSQKTGTDSRIKLPDFAIKILDCYAHRRTTIFPPISLSQFNKNLKRLFELAGWTEEYPKIRRKNGAFRYIQTKQGRPYRFCDLASSHMMRKTAITTMLLLGMPEPLVRKVSGHAPNSKEFYRYVKYSQSFLDEHTDAVFKKLAGI
jgi:integrase